MIPVSFPGANSHMLAGIIDLPSSTPQHWAILAHCFTCGKDMPMARTIAKTLAASGIAVLRFDFAGLGGSMGDFAETSFSSNVDDLVAAARWLEINHKAPAVLIGHSLGGAAALAAASLLHSAKAVVTIGAPAHPAHVRHLLSEAESEIETQGHSEVILAGRSFVFHKQFLDDLDQSRLDAIVPELKCAKLFLHSPTDQTVGIENAAALFGWARHPKSFVTLDNADHLVSRSADAAYAACLIAAWSARYL